MNSVLYQHIDLTASPQMILFLIYQVCVRADHMLHEKYNQRTKFLVFICLSVATVAGLSSGTYFRSASAPNMTSMESTGTKNRRSEKKINYKL